MSDDDGIRWHSPKGEIITLPGFDPSEPPLTPSELIQGEIIRATWRMKQTAERNLTPAVRQALADDAQAVLDALGRYAGCGD